MHSGRGLHEIEQHAMIEMVQHLRNAYREVIMLLQIKYL